MKRLIFYLTCVSMICLSNACTSPDHQNTTATSMSKDQALPKGQSGVVDEESSPNILQIAINSKDHTTLVAGVQAASLEDVLTNAGPLTVFAPTNDAFAKLPEGTLEDLLKPENKAVLANIITFHAAPGNYGPNNIKGVMGIGQATGDKVKVELKDGVTYVNGAKVLGSVKASNGYIHVIDQVLLPPEQ